MGQAALACTSRDMEGLCAFRHTDCMSQYQRLLAQYVKLEPGSMPSRKQMEATLRPHLERFFDSFDTARSGVLSKDDSEVFFHALVSNSSPFESAKFDLHAIVMKLQASKQFTSPPSQQERQEQLPSIEVLMAAIQIEKEQHQSDYSHSKDELDTAAFKVLDTNGDGMLLKKSVVAALLPNTVLNNRFLEALGFQKLNECSEAYSLFLKKYVRELEKFARCNPDSRPEIDELYDTLRPLIEILFKMFDKSGTGKINKDDADVFFECLVRDTSTFCEAIKHSQEIRTLMEVNRLMQSQEHLLEKKIQSQQAHYAESKKQSNMAAFSVLDSAQNGELEQEEVVQALLPDTNLNDQFLDALGYTRIKARHL